MTDRWRSNIEDDRARRHPPDERRQNRPWSTGHVGTGEPAGSRAPTAGREDASHGPDGGLDSGRGFGRIGVPRSDPWADERRTAETGRGPWTYSRREDYTGRGPKNYRRPDERILEDVSDRLTADAMVDASEITVDVKQGEVTLAGTVRDRDQKRRAEDLSERVSGVKDVINALRIVEGAKPGT
jgi:hypothetical protein